MQLLSCSSVAFACAQESLRLDPALKISYRYATEDTTMGDLVVPAGTRLGLALVAVSFSIDMPAFPQHAHGCKQSFILSLRVVAALFSPGGTRKRFEDGHYRRSVEWCYRFSGQRDNSWLIRIENTIQWEISVEKSQNSLPAIAC